MSIEAWNQNLDSNNLDNSENEKYISELSDLFDDFSGDSESLTTARVIPSQSSSSLSENIDWLSQTFFERINIVFNILEYIIDNSSNFPKTITYSDADINRFNENFELLYQQLSYFLGDEHNFTPTPFIKRFDGQQKIDTNVVNKIFSIENILKEKLNTANLTDKESALIVKAIYLMSSYVRGANLWKNITLKDFVSDNYFFKNYPYLIPWNYNSQDSTTEASKLAETLSENDVRDMLAEYRNILWDDMIIWADRCSVWAIWTGLTKVSHHYFWEYNNPQKTTFFLYSPSKEIVVEVAVKTEEGFDK